MHGTAASTKPLVDAIIRQHASHTSQAHIILCPPFTLLSHVAQCVSESGIRLGAQNCHEKESGAHTGEVSGTMLKDSGVHYVILGHSERRAAGETNASIAQKVKAARAAGLTPILCVGESEAEREAGKAEIVVRQQLTESIPEEMSADDLLIAYEPVWAIGTGKVATQTDIEAMHTYIKKMIVTRGGARTPVLYGGSVKATNARTILLSPVVDGVLVGGASLSADEFNAIITAGIQH